MGTQESHPIHLTLLSMPQYVLTGLEFEGRGKPDLQTKAEQSDESRWYLGTSLGLMTGAGVGQTLCAKPGVEIEPSVPSSSAAC